MMAQLRWNLQKLSLDCMGGYFLVKSFSKAAQHLVLRTRSLFLKGVLWG